MSEGLDFGMLWPVPAGRFGWSARGNTPCVMEIVSWLTAGTIDTAWPGVSRSIAEYVQAVQDAMDDEPRQKLLVLVPALIRCAKEDDPPEIESEDSFSSLKDRCRCWYPLSLRLRGGRTRPTRCVDPAVALHVFEAPCARGRNTPRPTLS
jgi:hypothetical protein